MSKPSRLHRALPALGLGLAALCASGSAAAYEKQWHVGADFGYAALLGATTSHGFGGGLHLGYGITDYLNLIAEVNTTWHPYAQWTVLTGTVGAAYVVDVLQWVPYVGATIGPGGLLSSDKQCGLAIEEPCHAFRLAIDIPFGLDYQVSRSFTVGVAGRFQLLLLGHSPWETLGAFARAEYVWGY